mgnify:CR=1 FL=1
MSDIISDILLFWTYFKVSTDVIKTVPMLNHSSVLNDTARTCTFLEENDDVYTFSCDEYQPIFASLTLLFIYMPSLNVLATLYGPRTAGRLGFVWGGLVLAVVGAVLIIPSNYVLSNSVTVLGVLILSIFLIGMAMFFLGS